MIYLQIVQKNFIMDVRMIVLILWSLDCLMNNLDEITVTCTDNGKSVIGYILEYRPKEHLEISLNTVKIYLQYRKGTYVGSMSGMEFTVEESLLPKEHQEYQR